FKIFFHLFALQVLLSVIVLSLACRRATVADIVFMVDGSTSINDENFEDVKAFLSTFVSGLDIGRDKIRIGLVQYSDNPNTEFLLKRFSSKSGRSFAFRGGQALRTGSAIDYLLRIFFTESAGSRKKEGVPQIAIIITSASSQDDVIVPARALRNHGVKVISIGVRNSELTEMKKIAFLPNFPFVFQISAFSALVQLSDRISTAMKTIVRNEFLIVDKSASVADIVFLVDESGSIGTVNFQLIRSFLYNFIDILEVSPDYVHIGLAQYSNSPVAEFYLNRYQNKSDVLDHIQSMTYRGGGRNTETALNFVRQTYFTDRSGSRARIGIPQLLIVITSGESEDKMGKAAATLRRSGVIMFALGIQNANETELRHIASYPSRSYISKIDDYIQLSAIERNFQKKVCSEIGKQTAVVSERTAILEQGCIETEEADIFFLIDGSGSIQPDNFQDMKMFMKEVAKTFRIGANKVRIGVVQFGSAPQTEFDMTQYSTNTELEMAMNQIVQIGGGTETGRALTYMKTLFSEAAKTRSYGVRRFLIIITDGQSEDSVEIPAEELRQEGIVNYAIGAGEADPAELLLIGGFQEKVFYVTSLDFLIDLKNSIVREICSVEGKSLCVDLKLDTVDIIFLIDGSGSINVEDFAKMKMFMNSIVNKTSIGADKVQVGAIQFGSYPRPEFQLNTHSTKPDLQQAIYNIQQLGGGTQTGRALTFTADYFDGARGGRPNIAQYLIVITDGEAQDEVLAPAKALRDKGITVFAIGVFNANNTQLLEIGGSPDKVHYVENFDDLDDPEKQIFWEIYCARTDVGDIVFVIDGSGSIQQRDFESMKRFMVALVNNSDVAPDKVRFGAVVYGTTPVVQFQLNQYKTKSDVREAIYGMQREGGSTFTALALKEAKGLLTTEEGGPRSDRVAQFLIVITDGKATDSVNVPDTSKDIRDEGINIFAVGVAEANEEELQTIVGPTGNYFYVQNFETLKSITGDISKVICANTNPECKLQQADIVFLVDGSESIEAEDFRQMKAFMKKIVNAFEIAPNKVQIGLAQFSTLFRKEFFLKDFSERTSLIAEIEGIVQMNQGSNIGFALTNVNSLFTREAGSRKADGVPQFLLLITDGRSNDEVVAPANALRDENINIFALGIGKADINQLLQITASQDTKYFVETSKNIEKITPRIVRKICKDMPNCTVDVAVGFDVPRQKRFSNIFSGAQRLQTHLNDILQRMVSLQNVSCSSYLNIRVGFHIKNEAGGTVFESAFEKYNEDIVKKLKEIQLSRTDQIDLTATYLQSFSSKFERESGTNVIVIFTDGADDSMDRLKETSDRLKLDGVNMLIIVALENTPSLDDILNIEFGRGFGYRRRLTIGMRDIGSALLTEISTFHVGRTSQGTGQLGQDPSRGEMVRRVERGAEGSVKEKGLETGLEGGKGGGGEGTGGWSSRGGWGGGCGADRSQRNGGYGQVGRGIVGRRGRREQGCEWPCRNECPVYPTELVFALDMSADVTQAAFDRMKGIVVNFLQDLKISESNCPNGARVAVLTYSSTTKTFIRFSDFNRKKKLLEEIQNLSYERSTNRRNIGAAMRFVARNTLKRIRGGILVKKIAVFLANGPSQETSTISTAALEFSALDITPVVISFNNIPEVQRAFEVDDTKTFQVVVLPRQQQEARERLRRIQSCTFYMCEPNPRCQQVLRPPPIPISMDIAFIVDGSSNVRSVDFERLKIFLSSILDEFVTSRNPKAFDNRARVALVQHVPRDYVPRSGQQPVHLEFGFFNFSSKSTMKRYIQHSFDQLDGSSGVGHAIEWTLNNVFATAPTPRRYKVLFLLVAGDTSVWDKAKLLAASLQARCQGFSVFIFSFGMDTVETDLEDLVSFPFDHHLIRLGRLLEPEMRYAHRFTRAFLKSLTRKCNIGEHDNLHDNDLNKADIIFLIDGSGSINSEDFMKMKAFMASFVKKVNIGSDKVQIGAIQFSSAPTLVFELNRHSAKPDLQHELDSMQQLGGGTETGQALTFTADYFHGSRGGRPNIAQYLIVITDGEAQDEVLTPAKALRDKGITIFAIGIFNANMTQLLEIGGSPTKVHYIENFDALTEIQKQILWEICSPWEGKLHFSILVLKSRECILNATLYTGNPPEDYVHNQTVFLKSNEHFFLYHGSQLALGKQEGQVHPCTVHVEALTSDPIDHEQDRLRFYGSQPSCHNQVPLYTLVLGKQCVSLQADKWKFLSPPNPTPSSGANPYRSSALGFPPNVKGAI
uniref:Collagen type VI alpha 6 chain n=1 Tax=Callorhinchus milii TaxID=7868 RepID=A0A4W3GCD4_CALMI